ncbi:hypothetical protein C8A00DRAFT_38578 [Chaetomidium leptoderma]|uniref:FAD-binding PCMH-type domain-containing protein n=1 Tax=Chaetomidium leptoderma TaxID=669021 RepID=A0AAN6ZR86_9PEZI|nr:hypothetical protein C8A00DRAFT_38578 [Chaetomidium leptoderma]
MSEKRTIPTGASEPQLGDFLRFAATIVGDENVSQDSSSGAPAGIEGSCSYGDPFPLGRTHTPGPAVRPATVDQVREVVRAANRFRVHLWTISQGKNLGYGGSAPVVDGSVVLDLHRMNKIIEINEEYAYAIVEPGVRFMDLYDEIQRRKLNLWLSVPAVGWGSVIGNTLERGIGYTPEAAHYKHQCGMEVVLPDGDLLRTGMGVVEDSKVWPLYSGGFGPGLDGLFFQSNYGVVTKMGIHMSPAPQAYTRILVEVPNESDLAPLTGAMTELMRQRIITNPPQLFNRLMLLIEAGRLQPDIVGPVLGKHATFTHHIPEDLVNSLADKSGLPAWRAGFALYGPPELHEPLLAIIKRRFESVNNAKLTSETFRAPPGEYLKGADVAPDFLPQNGVPSLDQIEPFSLDRENGLWHNCYSPVLPPSGRELLEWYLGAKKITAEHDLNFAADFHVFDRYVISINFIMFHPSAEGRLREVQKALMEHSKKLGYMEYRTHVSFMDETAANQTFNDRAFGRFTTLLKDAVDPNGVLAPGKQGIWNSGASREGRRT